MGTLTLSGVLKRPVSGDVVPNARIIFDAIATGSVVLKGVSSSCKTAADGSYSVELEYGDYAIQVSWAGQTQQYGTVHIDDTTPIGSLNDLLMQSITESEVTPEIVLEFRQLQQEMQEDLAEMEELNGEASASASAAATSQSAAATSETNSAASEKAAADSAAAAKTSENNSAASEDASAASAAAAQTSETNSAASEDAAAASAAAAKTSETNSAASEAAAADSATAAKTSETNSAASEDAAAASATAAKTSETNSANSAAAAATSEINADNARDAAEEYAQEAKDAASKVTSPLTDQGVWAIQSGYPTPPSVSSIWQVTDGGVDPVNSEIVWDSGDMLVYLASADVWCRLLGQQTIAGEPVALTFDADIILNAGAGLQIVTSGTKAVDVARLDSDNYLVLGNDTVPGVSLKAADPTNFFVLVPDGNGGYTRCRIYSEQHKPTASELGFGTAVELDATVSTTDSTAGRAVKVGDFGLGTGTQNNTSNINLDTVNLPVGFYSGNTWSGTLPDGMSTASNHWAYLQVENLASAGTNFTKQTLSTNDLRDLWVRFRVNGTWEDWQQVFTTKYPPTAEQTGALPLTGGTISKDLKVDGVLSASNLGTAAGLTATTSTSDATAGRAVKVGDFGNFINDTTLKSDLDFSSYKFASGECLYVDHATALNEPAGFPDSDYFLLCTGVGISNVIHSLLIVGVDNTTPAIIFATMHSDGGWVLSSVPYTAEAVGALSLTDGGIVTGNVEIDGATTGKGGILLPVDNPGDVPDGGYVTSPVVKFILSGRGALDDDEGAVAQIYYEEHVGIDNALCVALNGFGGSAIIRFVNSSTSDATHSQLNLPGGLNTDGWVMEQGERVYSPNNPQPITAEVTAMLQMQEENIRLEFSERLATLEARLALIEGALIQSK